MGHALVEEVVTHGRERRIYRCRRCKFTLRRDMPVTTTTRTYEHHGQLTRTREREYDEQEPVITCHCPPRAVGTGLANERVHYKTIKGTTNPDEKCGARCLASKGPTCDCSCGGENHGKSWT